MPRTVRELRARLQEAEELLRAIRNGEADAVVVSGPHGDQVYTLSGAEHAYRVMVEAMSEGAVIVAGDGTISYSNHSFAAILNMPLDQVIGSMIGRFVLPEDLPRCDALMQHRRGGISKAEIRLVAQDDSVVPVYISISSFEAGSPAAACVVVTDLTEHKRHQELIIAESLERMKRAGAESGQRRIASILESVTDSFFSMDREWRITDVNQRAAATFGGTREELTGKMFWQLTERSDPDVEEQYRKAMMDRVTVHHDGPSILAEGRWLEKHIYPTDEGVAIYFRDITERKGAEARTAYQANLLASIHDAIIATDDRFVLTAWNSRAEETYGWKADEVLGRGVGDVIHAEFTDAQRSEAMKSLAESGHYDAEVAQYTRDGRRVWMHGHVTVLKNGAGHITGYVAANRDITERKRAEDELRQSEANLAEAQELSHTGSWRWSVATGQLFWSLEHFRIFGVDPRTFRPTAETTRRFIHPQDLPLVEETLEKAIRDRCGFELHHRIVRPDGSIRHHRRLGRPVVSDAGDLEFVGSVVDVTDRVQAEEELRRSESYLVEGQRISHTGSWALNVSTGEYFWSLEHFRICGVDPATFTPSPETTRQLIHPDDRISVYQAFEKAIEERGDFARELRVVRPDRTVRYVQSFAHPVFNESGDVTEYVGTIMDVTERKEADAERARLLRQVVQTQEDERRRIAIEMHDQIGQQLSALGLKLSALRRDCGRRTRLARELASLEAINKQLDTDLELLVWRLRPTALDDLGLIPALTNYVTRWSQHFNIHAEVHVTGMERGRLTDEVETALYRLTQEALNNVAKHSAARNVAILLDRRQDRVSLIVEDDGIGFQVDPSGTRQRFGIIGMRERATLLGGMVDIESHAGRGTTVVARLPAPSNPEWKPI